MTDDKTYDEMILAGVIRLTEVWMQHQPSLDLQAIPNVAATFYRALNEMDFEVRAGTDPEPAVDIATAMTGDTMLCIDCGQPFKSLKRHIRTTHGLTPEEYRERWKLPVDYPMVAPNYSAVRSQLAKDNGLGTR